MSRAEFSPKTKETLAQRAGHRCSFPGCAKVTVGPSAEGAEAISRSGDAAHIIAASGGRGARRVVPGTAVATLKSITNGIWMCATHARMIDRDEMTYSIPMLQTWRKLAERRAKLIHELGERAIGVELYGDILLPEDTVRIRKLGNENVLIGDALKFACVGSLWGSRTLHAVRDLAIELTRNALFHGEAGEVSIEIEPRRIVISDDGKTFSHSALMSSPSPGGGTLTLSELVKAHADRLLVSWCGAQGNRTIISFLREPSDALAVTNCAVELNDTLFEKSDVELGIDQCETVYLVMNPYPCISDLRAHILLRCAHDKSRRYVLVLRQDESSELLASIAREAGLGVMAI